MSPNISFTFSTPVSLCQLQGQQYVCVCAGELVALQALTNVLNYLTVQNIDIAKVCGELFLGCYLYAYLYHKVRPAR